MGDGPGLQEYFFGFGAQLVEFRGSFAGYYSDHVATRARCSVDRWEPDGCGPHPGLLIEESSLSTLEKAVGAVIDEGDEIGGIPLMTTFGPPPTTTASPLRVNVRLACATKSSKVFILSKAISRKVLQREGGNGIPNESTLKRIIRKSRRCGVLLEGAEAKKFAEFAKL